MKKKCYLALLSIFVLMLLVSCKKTDDSAVSTTTPVEITDTTETVQAQQTPVPEETIQPTATPTSTTQATQMPTKKVVDQKKMKAMTPIIDAIAHSGNEFSDGIPVSSDIIWEILYNVANSVGTTHPGKQAYYKGEQLVVTKKLMQEYAATCFSGYTDLPDIPKGHDNITYDAKKDVYVLYSSDTGDWNVEYDHATANTDGTYTVIAKGYSTDQGDEPTDVFELKFVDNPHVNEASNPTYYYSVNSFVYK